MSMPDLVNLNTPRLPLADKKISEAELNQLLRRRFMPEAADQESAVAAVAAGIAMHSTPPEAHTGEHYDDEGRDALEQQLDAVNAGVWRWGLAGFAAIGLLWVLLR